MKKFFFQVLSSFMGAWLAIVLSGVVAVLLVVALIGSMVHGSGQSISKQSVLKISLGGVLEERPESQPFSLQSILSDNGVEVQSLDMLTSAIKEAAENPDIKHIYLDCEGLSGAPASLNALRNELIEFKKNAAGKKIFAYGDYITQADYFIASVADEIVLNPAGELQMRGIGGVSLYYKDFLDKIGVQFQAVRVGKGKAAVEPFTLSQMSDVAREQNMQLFAALWVDMRTAMSESRQTLTAAMIDTIVGVDLVSCRPASYVLEKKLVTSLEYRHAFEARLAKACGNDDGELNVATPSMLVSDSGDADALLAQNQVAVLYACGGIDDVLGAGGINSADLTEQIFDLAENDKVKALVLRVNSPGGSAFGSEQIWEALEQFKKTGKPFVVSMGDYAASGGYYISCGAQRIFADQLTITGSIGIFGLIPNIQGLCDKLGLNAQMVATNPQAVFPNLYYPLDEQQLAAMQGMVQNGYDLFVKRVADGRHTTIAKVEEIADGRPLSARAAKEYGLVDQIGFLNDAVLFAAEKAGLKDKKYKVVNYPNQGSMFEKMLADMQKGTFSPLPLVKGDYAAMLPYVRNMLTRMQGSGAMQTLMPTLIFTY